MRSTGIGFALLGCLVLGACGGGGGGGGDGDGGNTSTPPATPPPTPPPNDDPPPLSSARPTVDGSTSFNDVPVHDPSVVQADDGSFYVIGSHLAMARSTDLVTWQQVAEEGVVDANPLFDTYASEIAEGVAWVGGHVGSWASDIEKLADGRWYFYYDHCATADDGLCDYPRSYLGVAVADGIQGPYRDLGTFLWSGQTDAEIASGGFGVGGITSFDPTIHPNVIDPHTFHDANGLLWMVYGSYSGGIFILQMDEATGKPFPGQGYGKHLAGGSHSAIEGPFILYSPETAYYYLFTSFGGFEADDGYNIRISRSRNPDGPYVDAEGNDMTGARGTWSAIEPFGVKLMGGFKFSAELGSDTPARGYLAPGHNSAWYDAGDNRYYLIHHTRFVDRGQAHAVRVHEMFVNADDWLVVSPHRYVPLAGDNVVGPEDAAGSYRLVDHGKDINRTARQSAWVTLHDDASVSGATTGSYELSERVASGIRITLEGVDYSGVIRWQWDAGAAQLVPAISAVSSQGASVWLSRAEDKTDAVVVQEIADDIAFPAEFSGSRLEFPVAGTRGAGIEWSTNDPDVVAEDGTVTRPNVGEGDRAVTITAVIELNGETANVTRTVLVPQRSPYNRVASFGFESSLGDGLGNFAAGQGTGDRIWKIGEGVAAYATGQDGLALSLDGTNGVRLPDGLIANHEYSVSMWVNPSAVTEFTTAFFGAVNEQEAGGDPFSENWISLLPQGWDGNTMFWSGSESWLDGITGELISENAWSHLGFSVDQGLVRVFINGQNSFAGGNLADFFTAHEGRFALGVNYWDTPYAGLIDELNIYDAALSAGEMQALDIDRLAPEALLQIATDLLDIGDLSAVKEDIPLPRTGPFAAAIDWASSDPATIAVESGTGVVNRPSEGAPDATVVLTAMLALDGQTASRDFEATVSRLGLPDPLALFSFEDTLADSTGNFGAGTVLGDRIATPGGVAAFETGVAGRALVLDGATGIALDADMVTDDTYTLSVWLNPVALEFYSTALFGGPDCAADAAPCESWISIVPGGLDPGGQTMLWSGTQWYDAPSGARIPVGEWTHFVAVNDNGDLRVYLDGAEVFSGTNFPDVFGGTSGASFWIGVNHWDNPYRGGIDELAFFDQPLTAGEVNALYGNPDALLMR